MASFNDGVGVFGLVGVLCATRARPLLKMHQVPQATVQSAPKFGVAEIFPSRPPPPICSADWCTIPLMFGVVPSALLLMPSTILMRICVQFPQISFQAEVGVGNAVPEAWASDLLVTYMDCEHNPFTRSPFFNEVLWVGGPADWGFRKSARVPKSARQHRQRGARPCAWVCVCAWV